MIFFSSYWRITFPTKFARNEIKAKLAEKIKKTTYVRMTKFPRAKNEKDFFRSIVTSDSFCIAKICNQIAAKAEPGHAFWMQKTCQSTTDSSISMSIVGFPDFKWSFTCISAHVTLVTMNTLWQLSMGYFLMLGDSRVYRLRRQNLECNFGLSWFRENRKMPFSSQMVLLFCNKSSNLMHYGALVAISVHKF